LDYELIRYDPRFKDQILSLQTALWSEDLAMNAAYFEWKYERNPYLDPPLIYLGLHDGKVVGMRGMMGARWRVGRSGDILIAPCAGDTTVQADHRRRGLFRRINEFAMQDLAGRDIPFVTSFSASRVVYFAALTMEWRFLGPYGLFRRPARSGAGGRTAVRKVRISTRAEPAGMADLMARLGSDGRVQQVKDRTWLAWRFQNPLSKYTFLYHGNKALDGYLVLQARTPGTATTFNIVDWEASTDQVLFELLVAAIQFADLDLVIWSATLPAPVLACLTALGFERQGTAQESFDPGLLLRPTDDGLLGVDWIAGDRPLGDMASWNLRMIYSDGY
jgi:hypothetical protein